VRTVVLTCSAGALNPAYGTGEVVAIRDHLNLTGASPLTGVPAVLGPGGHGTGDARSASEAGAAAGRGRHVDLTDAWSPRLRTMVAEVAPGTAEGVYAQLCGPELETPAEIRMLAGLGADLVGMSTVHEAIAARHLGAEVVGLAVACNPAAGTSDGPLEVDDIVAASVRACPAVAAIVGGLLDRVAARGRGAGGGHDAEQEPPATGRAAVHRAPG
jgi:purine-nucleoside phosphorylase